jgi:hypothetical protein
LGKVRCIRIFDLFRRFRNARWRQVGVIIGVLRNKAAKIEPRCAGEFDLEDVPCGLVFLGSFARDVPRGLGVPWAGEV